MATKSFTRDIVISDSAAVKKINDAIKANSIDRYKTPINNIEEILVTTRKKASESLTKKF